MSLKMPYTINFRILSINCRTLSIVTHFIVHFIYRRNTNKIVTNITVSADVTDLHGMTRVWLPDSINFRRYCRIRKYDDKYYIKINIINISARVNTYIMHSEVSVISDKNVYASII